jgi:hypothetical protein
MDLCFYTRVYGKGSNTHDLSIIFAPFRGGHKKRSAIALWH